MEVCSMINLVWHMGLGDAIACAAIAVKLSLKDEVTVPCWTKNEVSVKSLFVSHPNIKVLPMDNDCWIQDKSAIRSRPNPKTVLLGVYNREDRQKPEEDFVQWFYRQAGMDISEKEKYCPIKEASFHIKQESAGLRNYISLYHQDDERRFYIGHGFINCENEWPVTRVEGVSILSYRELIETADYIHCIDSSFIHLVEAIKTNAVRVYHKYARPNSTDFKYLKGWEVIE